jgi:protein-tyrosine phosphatase
VDLDEFTVGLAVAARVVEMSGSFPRYRSILFICHANTSRSVIAEALLRRMMAAQPLPEEVLVVSGGVASYARDGALASMDARLVLRDEGIDLPPDTTSMDLKRHPEVVDQADLILAMTEEQIGMLLALYPHAADKPVHTLKEFAGHGGDIDDPVGKSEDVFAACLREIKDCLEAAMPRLLMGARS